MTLLYTGVADGSRNIITYFKSKKKSTNKKIRAIIAIGKVVTLHAIAFFFGLARWAMAGFFN
jgi:hypothetical protein